jgi:amidase
VPDESSAAGDRLTGRRAFLRRGGAAIALSALPAVLRADQFGADLAAPAAPSLDDGSLTEFHEITLGELAEGIGSGRWTSRTVVDWYLDAIARVDRGGPVLNSILEVNPDARDIADALDAEFRAKGPRGPLHGVPILVKDNIGTADRMHTSAGSLALAENIAQRDAYIVEKLRAAGAVILGKSNMSEWANARGKSSIGGWSGRGRLTRNPYALDRSAGGSSAGTAAAVSANLVAAAIGTETMGSIVSPAALCGIVGLKPTVGLVSRAGLIPVSITQDTAGPMTRTVRDAALLLTAIAGADPRDPMTAEAAQKADRDYTRFLDPQGLRGARIGVARNLFGVSLPADRVVARGLEAMRGAGAVLVDPADIETAEGIWSFDAEVLSYELKAALNEYLASLGPTSRLKTLADLIAYNVRHSDRELAWFGQETFEYAQQKGPLSSPEYQTALRIVRQLARTQGIDATIRKHRLDAIVAPTQSPAWLTDVLLGDNAMLGSFVAPSAAGYPSLTVPAGEVSGLPVGILFIGTAWNEGMLLKLGYAFEQTVRARRAPTFQPTILVRP